MLSSPPTDFVFAYYCSALVASRHAVCWATGISDRTNYPFEQTFVLSDTSQRKIIQIEALLLFWNKLKFIPGRSFHQLLHTYGLHLFWGVTHTNQICYLQMAVQGVDGVTNFQWQGHKHNAADCSFSLLYLQTPARKKKLGQPGLYTGSVQISSDHIRKGISRSVCVSCFKG